MKSVQCAAVLIFAVLLRLSAPPVAVAAQESMEAVEKDLLSVLKEMDAMSGELDRIEEIAKTPKATLLRVEVHREGTVSAPASIRIVSHGKVEDEREWAKAERDAFAGTVSTPLTVQIPFLPGSYALRVEVVHPSWTGPAAIDLPVTVAKGETTALRLRLSAQAGKTPPSLSVSPGK